MECDMFLLILLSLYYEHLEKIYFAFEEEKNCSKCINKGFDPKAVTRRSYVKNVFLKLLQNSQKNTCARVSFLIKL